MFQALVYDVLHHFLDVFVFVYLHDILIFTPNEEVHVKHVREVLKKILDNLQFVKAAKCKFHVTTVSFLGFIVSEGAVKMDPEKVKQVVDCPTPSEGVIKPQEVL